MQEPAVKRVTATARRPGVWLFVALFVAVAFLQMTEVMRDQAILIDLGVTRYTIERILYLLPILWAAFLFGWKGGTITSLVALGFMLPAALLSSPNREDALIETSLIFIIGNLVSYSLQSLRREQEHRAVLEAAQEETRASEQRYRELFENAHDAILVHDMNGDMIVANKASEKLSGYARDELVGMNVAKFLTAESLDVAREVKKKLLNGETLDQPYEQRLVRKDGTMVASMMATSPVVINGDVKGFQHIIRDVTAERETQENLHFLLQQITTAQEEERKRIAWELHDDTIQSLVALCQQIDDLPSGIRAMPKQARSRLEDLHQQANTIMREVRRLSQDLRPAVVDNLGLVAALEWLASDVSGYSGIATNLKVAGAERRLSTEVELVLFRIAQEAMRNVWKHAQASQAEITLEFGDGKTRVTVRDNGLGFDTRQLADDLKTGKLGLAGMRERAKLLGGALTVTSESGKGTVLTAELPL